MVSTFTPNVGFEEPARGDYVGTWDTPVNANETLADLILGGRTTISGAAGSVVLAAAQFQCKTITFNSTLLASIVITFPTSFTKSYEIYHTCTGSSAFVITMQTTAAGGQVICASPGEIIEVVNDGTNLRYKNLGRVGSYWDYAGSSVPAWVSGCTIPPYLNCDASTFSSAVYPTLAGLLGGVTLPDSKGRFRATLDQSAGRLSSAVIGFSPNTVGAGGSSQSVTITQANLPNVNFTVTGTAIPTGQIFITTTTGSPFQSAQGGGTGLAFASGAADTAASAAVTGNAASGGAGTAIPTVPPAYIGGITMIRAG